MACTTPDLRLLSQSHYRPLTGTKLYCLVTEAHVCEQLAQGCYLKARGRESNLRPSESQVQRPNHYAIRPHPYRRRSKKSNWCQNHWCRNQGDMLDICTLASERGGTNRMFVSPCTPRHIHLQNFTENAIETRKNLGGNASWGETHIISSLTAKPTNLKPQNLQRTACLLTRKNRRNPTVSCSLHFLNFIKIYSFLDFVYTQAFTDSQIRVKFGVEELIDG